jgi:hypothetical protein
MKATRRVAVRTCIELSSPQFLGSEVIEMIPLKVEETLHDYLRRYFEKVSKGNAQQFAKQNEGTKAGIVPDISSSNGSGS